jgi:hypothetical protein
MNSKRSLQQVDQTEGDHTGALRRLYPRATTIPIAITVSVASKLPGAMQLMQVPMIIGASYMAAFFLLPTL